MPVSAETLRALMAAGVTGDALLSVVEKIDADMEAATPAKKQTAGAIRQARYRANLRGEVTPSDVTVTHNSDVTNPPKEYIKPPTSLRSEIPSARKALWLRFREAYPKKPGHEWQPAEEKFYRWLKAGVDGEAMISGAEAYAKSRAGEDPKYTKAPLVFLNRQSWKDDHDPLPSGHMNGARASPRRCNGPTMGELSRLDQPQGLFDEPRTYTTPEPKPNPSDPKASGFAGRFSVEDRGNGIGQVLDLRSFSAVRG